MMDNHRLNLVITGHIDHGKSTLIGRLLYETGALQDGLIKEIKSNLKGTGIKMEFAHIMDYFQEERLQERTIDTTQFHFKTKKRHYVIIDTPGHKEFLKNMITGSSQAQAAILIISAKEGLQEQTKRHAYILNILGIKDIILVINKMDLVSFSQDKIEEIKKSANDISTLLGIKQENIIPISAQKGDNISRLSKNMPWHKGFCLVEALDRIKIKQSSAKEVLRFPIQDIYSIDGKKVVVGRLVSGKIKVGDNVVIFPKGIKAKIKSLEVFEKKLKAVYAGQNIGITTKGDVDLERGEVISGSEFPPLVKNKIKAHIFWFSPKECIVGNGLEINCGTFQAKCSVEQISEKIDSSSLGIIEKGGPSLEETQVGKVVIAVDRHIVVDDFNILPEMGRFILLKDNQVCAGGIITNR